MEENEQKIEELRKLKEILRQGSKQIESHKEDIDKMSKTDMRNNYESLEKALGQKYDELEKTEKYTIIKYYKTGEIFIQLLEEKLQRGMKEQNAREEIYKKEVKRKKEVKEGTVKKRYQRAEWIYKMFREIGIDWVNQDNQITISKIFKLKKAERRKIIEYYKRPQIPRPESPIY